MSETGSFPANFNDFTNEEDRKDLFERSEIEEICDLIVNKADVSLGFKAWSSVLSLLDDEEKLFEIIKDVS